MKYIVSILMSLFLAVQSQAVNIKIAWNQNPETNIALYTVAYKAASDANYTLASVNHPTTEMVIPNLIEGTLYSFKVRAINTKGLSSLYSIEIFYQIPIPQDPIVSIDRSKWVPSASSATLDASKATDDDPSTYWAAAAGAVLPQSFVVDLGSIVSTNGIGYLPPSGSNATSGRIRNYVIQTSLDGLAWNETAQGEFSNNEQEKLVVFPMRDAKFVKLIANSDWDKGTNGTAIVSEFKVIGEYILPPSAPQNLRITP